MILTKDQITPDAIFRLIGREMLVLTRPLLLSQPSTATAHPMQMDVSCLVLHRISPSGDYAEFKPETISASASNSFAGWIRASDIEGIEVLD